MYGENGGLMRAELSELLRVHRIQHRIGGKGHGLGATTTVRERQQIGDQVRRYRQGILVWCHQATLAVWPRAASNLPRHSINPFRGSDPHQAALASLRQALEQAIDASTAPLPTLHELVTPQHFELVEHWRHAARAAALGEHDFTEGLGHGHLDARQRQTLIGDVAAVVQALVVLDQRYTSTPGWERLHGAERLGWRALACALDASLEPPDYAIDMRGWRPPSRPILGPAKPGLLGVLQAEHNLVVRMQCFPSAMNLRLIVDSQRLLSRGLAELASTTDPDLQTRWQAREQTYLDLQHHLRNIGSRIGTGGRAVPEGANAVSRLKAIRPDEGLDPRALHGFTTLFAKLDERIADILETGIRRNAYLQRATMPRLVQSSGRLVTPPWERFIPLGEAEHTAILELVGRRLRPAAEPQPPPRDAARSRAELHAAIVHHPRRGAAPDAPKL